MEKYEMKQTEALTAEMVETCKAEFLASEQGRPFKEHWARLEQEMENLHNQMDAHIYTSMRNKYGI